MSFSLFNKKSRVQKFWDWFSKHEKHFYQDLEDLQKREYLFHQLSVNLKKVQAELVFEFSPIHDDGRREFTISADGIKSVFPKVIELVEQAPDLENWQINAFRQPVPGDEGALNFGDLSLTYQDIFFRYQDGVYGKLGIELHIRNYDGSAQFQHAVYLLLDALLGEYDVTMGIDWIEWERLADGDQTELQPLTKLRDLINQKKN